MLRQFTHASLFALAVVGVTFGSSGLALAGGPPSVSVDGKADYLNMLQIAVVVTANCGAGSSAGEVDVTVSQSGALGDNEGTGFTPFTSDGTRQQVVVLIDGGPMWNVGPASASALLFCGDLVFQLADLDLGARITIQ